MSQARRQGRKESEGQSHSEAERQQRAVLWQRSPPPQLIVQDAERRDTGAQPHSRRLQRLFTRSQWKSPLHSVGGFRSDAAPRRSERRRPERRSHRFALAEEEDG
ncbi:hypothetical protein EYF80_066054 [Liparis tanakae]|uniref:Uncharacterized protein n=1 Tax=Liparis tanakae TaxID=230148 RepID=A0A4Z2E5D9_9TELE|nr:hypothetical protein EYF80_066054 [Liparis tanakae]